MKKGICSWTPAREVTRASSAMPTVSELEQCNPKSRDRLLLSVRNCLRSDKNGLLTSRSSMHYQQELYAVVPAMKTAHDVRWPRSRDLGL